MPRRARIMLADVPVHVIQRGNNRGACFVNDEDRNFYLFHLARGLVQYERYMLACYRYIELNPVRAGMVIHPGDYPWSSYCNNALGEAAARLVMPHSEYLRLGESTQERQKVYTGLFGSAADNERLEEIRTATNGGYALGDELFRRTMARALR